MIISAPTKKVMFSESESDLEDDLLNILFLNEYIRTNKKKVKKRRYWVHKINRQREIFGEYHTLIGELESDEERFFMYFRMSKIQFEEIHNIIKYDIRKEHTHLRKPISTRERLAVCLRFLATGNSFRSIGFSYRMGFSTTRIIVKEVCEAIWKLLGPIVMPQPTEDMWKQIATDFKYFWNFPNCIGALDGKHVNIKCPINGGSDYWNYKGQNSIVLLALVDAHYKFVVVDVGSYGRNSDGGIYEKSTLGKLLHENKLNIPKDQPLMPGSEPLPYVIVGDEAFPLKNYLLRPYGKNLLLNNESNKIFNYRLSRARRIVENAFGILRARWRVFQGPMQVQPEMVDKIVLAACCLHNYLGTVFDVQDEQSAKPTTQEALTVLDGLRRNATLNAYSIREKFKEYFNSPGGSVPWQLNVVRKTTRNYQNEND